MGEEMKGKVSLDVSAFEAAAKKAQETAKSFGVSVSKNLGIDSFKGMVAGALSVAGVTTAITSLLDKADNIDALAKRFDLSAEAIQSIQFAADQSGASADAMFMGLKKLSIAIDEARSGNADYITSLQSMGVSLDDIKTKNAEQIFYQIGEKANGASVESIKLGDAIKVFGRAGDQVLGAMRDGFADVAKGAKDAGVVIENDLVKKLADAKDNIEKLKLQATVLTGRAIGAVFNVAERVAEARKIGAQNRYFEISENDSSFANLANNVPDLIATLAAFAGGLGIDKGGLFSVRKAKGQSEEQQPIPFKQPIEYKGVSFQTGSLTANQRAGAYSARDPVLDMQVARMAELVKIAQENLKAQRDVVSNTKATVKAIEDTQVY
jgi:hypothetical protein